MHAHTPKSVETRARRAQAGRWLKSLREARGLTQRALAEQVGLRYYTFISQIESGTGRIPADQMAGWAEALGCEPRAFVTELMRYYDPGTHKMLFDGPGASA
jgi:transcriptional regulator with XRE-family HTH domain